jgi:DNA-directed RNA polymerase specialized sigma24 family protein
MQSNNRYRGIDSYALSCARFHAQRLSSGHPCFNPGDYEDIEQELVLYFLAEAPKYDPAKSEWRLHVLMIIQRRANELKERAEAQKRGGRIRPFSIYDVVPHEEDGDLSRVNGTASDEGLWGDAFASLKPFQLDLKADVQKALAKLTPLQRQLCEWLQEETPTEISRRTGIPRTTINSHIPLIRNRLRKAGLEKYFQIDQSDRDRIPKSLNERPKK